MYVISKEVILLRFPLAVTYKIIKSIVYLNFKTYTIIRYYLGFDEYGLIIYNNIN